MKYQEARQEEIIETIEPFEIVEDVEEAPRPVNGGEIRNPKQGWFFPNQDVDLPFGGEFGSLEEAEEANRKYLETHKKEL
jgi:hypothetical protein